MTGSQLNKSYFRDTDTLYGWGNMSYFTFLSEFNRSWEGFSYIEASVMTILFVLSTVGNVFILGFICKTKKSRTITNYFVANLALADILFVSSAPFVAHVRITDTWRLGNGMCHVLHYVMFTCGGVILWTMTAISIDRYVCINLSTSRRMSHSHAVLTCACIWVATSVLLIPLTLYFNVKDVNTEHGVISFCTLVWPKLSIHVSTLFVVLIVLFGYTVPLIVTIINYFRIYRKFWKSSKTIAITSNQAPIESRRGNYNRRRNLHILKTLIMLVLLYVVMWTPLFIAFGLIQYDITSFRFNLPSSLLVWTLIVAYMNPCINPFLYGVINIEIQNSCFCCCKRNVSTGENFTPTHVRINALTFHSENTVHL